MAHTHIHTHTYTHIHIHTHTHTNTHTYDVLLCIYQSVSCSPGHPHDSDLTIKTTVITPIISHIITE